MNSIQHGQGELRLRWELRGDAVHFEVCDDGLGPELPGDHEPDPERLSGRGLLLIGRLARHLETRVRGSRRCLAFSLGRGQRLAPAGFREGN
jgi:anti-sigma regulatory factor (Ser/Thr protein kinase)